MWCQTIFFNINCPTDFYVELQIIKKNVKKERNTEQNKTKRTFIEEEEKEKYLSGWPNVLFMDSNSNEDTI